MSNWIANKISEFSHKDMPWLATNDGEYIIKIWFSIVNCPIQKEFMKMRINKENEDRKRIMSNYK